jgi:hypothetical protein
MEIMEYFFEAGAVSKYASPFKKIWIVSLEKFAG